jgi:hypothetical protein
MAYSEIDRKNQISYWEIVFTENIYKSSKKMIVCEIHFGLYYFLDLASISLLFLNNFKSTFE